MKPASAFRLPSRTVADTLQGTVLRLAFLFGWTWFALFVIRGAADTPFHPDESTYIYMSHDFDTFFLEHNPAALAWHPGHAADAALRYRLLDPPLIRYLIGLSRRLAGSPPTQLNIDWNWSETWEENLQAGAMPLPDLLFIARLPAALLTALAPLLVFKISQQLGSSRTGIMAALLYGFNSLVLLHGRRAMSEGPMLFTALLAFWWIVREPQRPALTGLGAALAAAAKLTGLSLLAVALFAGAFRPSTDTTTSSSSSLWGFRIRALAWCLAIFVTVTLLLNPVLWGSPISALEAMGEARQKLHAAQVTMTRLVAPTHILEQSSLRLLAMLYHVYFAPLAFWDIPNYANQTQPAELHYLSLPLQHVLRDPISAVGNFATGGLLLTLTLIGIGFGAITLFRRQLPQTHPSPSPTIRLTLSLLFAWTVFTIAILGLIDIPFQRYYLPLVPIICIWAAYGLQILVQPLEGWITSQREIQRPTSHA